MTLAEIKKAVRSGKTVHWASEGYDVVYSHKEWYIVCTQNNHTIGLTWIDGITMNGRPNEFYISKRKT